MCNGFNTKADGKIDYLRFVMGPKTELYRVVPNAHLKTVSHFDFGAGIYIGHYFSDKLSLEFGLIRNDYSANIQLDLTNTTGDIENYFQHFIYPTMRSYQLAVLPVYRHYLSSKIQMYGMAGLQFIIRRKLDREGVENVIDEKIDDQGNVLSSASINLYANRIDPGFFLLRGDLGFLFQLKSYMQLDLSFSSRSGSLYLNSFKVRYFDEMNNVREAQVRTKGFGFSLNLGLKLDFN
jgi:hypothetical protein